MSKTYREVSKPAPKHSLSILQIILIAVVLVGGLGVGGYLLYKEFGAKLSSAVLEIGDLKVTSDQLALRQAHANIYYPGSGTPEVALAQLIQGYLAAELMKQQGVVLDKATWLAEEERIDKQTRDPATLAKIKFVYGKNHDDYLFVGILPDFAQSRIFKLYRSSPQFAESARKDAAQFLDEAEKNPSAFAALAEKHGSKARRMLVDPKKGLVPATEIKNEAAEGGIKDASPKSEQEMRLRAEMEAQSGEREVEAAKSLLARLANLSEGQVYGNTLEAPESFETVRLIRRNGDGSAEVEMASFSKPDFGHWFWEEAGKIPVKINHKELKARFISEVSWAKQLNLN
jgi:hypothetical protein